VTARSESKRRQAIPSIFCYNAGTASSTGYVDVDSFMLGETAELVTARGGRPRLDAAGKTFVADNGQLLRGPYASTEWTDAAPLAGIEAMKDLGFNAVHLYTESFDPDYPAAGSTAPGYAVDHVDTMVARTRDLGLYLVMTIGNGAHNGNHNRQWTVDFWNFYGSRYAGETHVLYEIQNKPVAWGPSYLTSTSPPGALDMEVEVYKLIRSQAPDTPVLLFNGRSPDDTFAPEDDR
jgi:endoglucanase